MSEKVEIRNAIIKSVQLSNADHGCLSMWIHLDYGGLCQGFGGYNLGHANLKAYKPEGGNYCGWWINRVMAIAGVSDYSELVGKTVRAKSEHSKVHAIGHIVKDDWFCPAEDFANG